VNGAGHGFATSGASTVSMATDSAEGRLFSGFRSGVMAISDYRAGK
jgi:hypothetical protein